MSTIGGIWRYSYVAELKRLQYEGTIELNQTLDQILGQLSGFRMLPTLIARDKLVIEGLRNEFLTTDVGEFFISAHELSGAHEISLIDAKGYRVFSSLDDTREDEGERSFAETSFFKTAMTGSLGYAFTYDRGSQRRSLNFARSVLADKSNQVGVVTVEVDLERFEREIRSKPQVVMLVDNQDVIYLSNRSELIFRRPVGFDDQADHSPGEGPYHPEDIRSFEIDIEQLNQGLTLWRNTQIDGIPRTALAVTRFLPQLDTKAILLVDVTSATKYANLNATLGLAILSLIMVGIFSIWQHRQRLIDRLKTEQSLTAALDQRIAERSAQLEQAQGELVQAAKLSALGKMSAGISHELNQPIASIQNFAVNAQRLLKRGDVPSTMDNLVEVEQLTDRMKRIIRNLRDFARKDELPKGPVDMSAVIQEALNLTQSRLKDDGIDVRTEGINAPAMVMGGKIRLQQVLVNLIENAVDAMSAQDQKLLEIGLHPDKEQTIIKVRDTGPGLREPDRVFEPFYTTKSVDNGDGLGLGLSIAYGFVESFGGALTAQNHPDQGAVLTLSLQSAPASGD